MKQGICFLIVGKQNQPQSVVNILRICWRIRTEHPQFGRESQVLLSHMEIKSGEKDQILMLQEWSEVKRLCVEYGFGIQPIQEQQLFAPSIAAIVGWALGHIVEDMVLLVAGDANNSSLAKISGPALWRYVALFYTNPARPIVSKDRCFALVSKSALDHCLLSAASGFTCRRRSLLAPVLSPRHKMWDLDVHGDFDFGMIQQDISANYRGNKNFLTTRQGMYEITLVAVDRYTVEDLIWMMELDAYTQGGSTDIYGQLSL